MATMILEKPRYPAPLMPRGREWTVGDLESLPDDGLRYELIDGMLFVTPGPTFSHQTSVVGLMYALRSVCPEDMQVFVAPFDYQPNQRRSLQPDIGVIRRSDAAEKNLVVAPLLVVEVLSPSTRRYDATLKRGVYEESGVASYWLFDPEVPSLHVSELVAGQFKEIAKAVGSEEIWVERPFPVRLCPAAAALLRPRHDHRSHGAGFRPGAGDPHAQGHDLVRPARRPAGQREPA
jgi:Uma2 family endonuclease